MSLQGRLTFVVLWLVSIAAVEVAVVAGGLTR